MADRKSAKSLLEAYHAGKWDATDEELDELLGITPTPAEEGLRLRDLLEQFGVHRFDHADTPYAMVRQLVSQLAPTSDTRVLDLGSGYGRLGLYAGVLTPIRYTGIEIVPARAETAQRAARELELREVRFFQGDALGVPWPASTCLCLLNSFLPSLMPTAITRMGRLSREASELTVISISTAATLLAREHWLREVTVGQRGPMSLRTFRAVRASGVL